MNSTPNLLNNASQAGQTQTIASSTAPRLNNATILRQDISNGKVTSKDTVDEQSPADTAEVLDAYDSDPPAHFPKPGHGLKLRPDNDDLEWLIDDNFEVFSHVYKVDERIGYLDGEREAYASTAR
ncbi:MAG: Integrator complex subunit 12 [Bathelium mastoideum]|nr:MAG: Integrator complex subunit 12 [Bathelium mastoideum]